MTIPTYAHRQSLSGDRNEITPFTQMHYKSIFYSAFCVKGVFLNFSFRTIWGFILSQQSSSHIPVFRPDTFSKHSHSSSVSP